MFLLSSMTPSLFPTRTYIAIAKVLSKSKWLYFQVLFLPLFPRDAKVKIVLTGGGKKETDVLDSCTIVASAPNSHRVCFAQVWFAPTSSTRAPGRWLHGELTVMEDFPAVFPCFSKDLDSFLWETICIRKRKVEIAVT